MNGTGLIILNHIQNISYRDLLTQSIHCLTVYKVDRIMRTLKTGNTVARIPLYDEFDDLIPGSFISFIKDRRRQVVHAILSDRGTVVLPMAEITSLVQNCTEPCPSCGTGILELMTIDEKYKKLCVVCSSCRTFFVFYQGNIIRLEEYKKIQ